MPEAKRILLQVRQKGVMIGYVAKAKKGSWPLVTTKGQAERFTNQILAEGAASQYFRYLREVLKREMNGYSIRYERVKG